MRWNSGDRPISLQPSSPSSVPVWLVLGCVGTDTFGEFVLTQLRNSGVNTGLIRKDPQICTGLGVTLADNTDRAILTVSGSIAKMLPENLPTRPELLCRHWHVASTFLLRGLRCAWGEFLRLSKSSGVTVSLDTNWDPDERWEGILEFASVGRCLFPKSSRSFCPDRRKQPIRSGEKTRANRLSRGSQVRSRRRSSGQ